MFYNSWKTARRTAQEQKWPPLEQEIRFCTSTDGVRIAYAHDKYGLSPLVKAANWLSHLEFDWNSPVWRHWLTELSRDHTGAGGGRQGQE